MTAYVKEKELHKELYELLTDELKSLVNKDVVRVIEFFKKNPEKFLETAEQKISEDEDYVKKIEKPEDLYVSLVFKFALSDKTKPNVKDIQYGKLPPEYRDPYFLSSIENDEIPLHPEVKRYYRIILLSQKDEEIEKILAEKLKKFEQLLLKGEKKRIRKIIEKGSKKLDEILGEYL